MYFEYEKRKKEIKKKNLSPKEYEKEIQKTLEEIENEQEITKRYEKGVREI